MPDDFEFTAQWQNFDAVKKSLNDMGKKAADSAVRKALRAGAKVLQKALIEAAPALSGATRRAIKVRAMKRKRSRLGMIVTMSARSFADVFYAGWVNYGHVWSKGRRKRFKQLKKVKIERALEVGEKRVPGTHWLENTSDAKQKAVEAAIKETLDAEINKYKTKGSTS